MHKLNQSLILLIVSMKNLLLNIFYTAKILTFIVDEHTLACVISSFGAHTLKEHCGKPAVSSHHDTQTSTVTRGTPPHAEIPVSSNTSNSSSLCDFTVSAEKTNSQNVMRSICTQLHTYWNILKE